MIATTYALAGILLAVTAGLFVAGMLDAATQTLAWTCVFFFASAAAMLVAAVAAATLGMRAEAKPLEAVAPPLSSAG